MKILRFGAFTLACMLALGATACTTAQDASTAASLQGTTNRTVGLLNTSCPVVKNLSLPVEILTQVASSAIGAPSVGALAVSAEQALATTCSILTANAVTIAANPAAAPAIVAAAVPTATVTPAVAPATVTSPAVVPATAPAATAVPAATGS